MPTLYSIGTKVAPGMRGPYDRRGFLLRRTWEFTVVAFKTPWHLFIRMVS